MSGELSLWVLSGLHAGTTCVVQQSAPEPCRLGRSGDCAIVLSDKTVSSRHLELQHRDGGWHVRDLGSANGTFLNGEELTSGRWIPFPENSCIFAGDIEIRLEYRVVVNLWPLDPRPPAPSPVSPPAEEDIVDLTAEDQLEPAELLEEREAALLDTGDKAGGEPPEAEVSMPEGEVLRPRAVRDTSLSVDVLMVHKRSMIAHCQDSLLDLNDLLKKLDRAHPDMGELERACTLTRSCIVKLADLHALILGREGGAPS